MSGIEIIGLAASVIQIAELGGKLSVQLFTFTRKVKNANKSIDALTQDIAATGAVLKQLGEALSKDDQLRACSPTALSTARALVEDTKKVFSNLEKLLDGDESANKNNLVKGISLKQRLKFPFLESKIQEVQANLERLKSSLLVILNVLIFAEQMRNQEALPILKDQRELIRVLNLEKDENERRYTNILRAIEDNPNSQRNLQDPEPASIDKRLISNLSSVDRAATHLLTAPKSFALPSSTLHTDHDQSGIPIADLDLPAGLKHQQERIVHHTHLVQKLVTEISSPQYKIDYGTRDRMHTGVLKKHYKEWASQRRRYGPDHLEEIFASYSDVVKFWEDELLKSESEDEIIVTTRRRVPRQEHSPPRRSNPSGTRNRLLVSVEPNRERIRPSTVSYDTDSDGNSNYTPERRFRRSISNSKRQNSSRHYRRTSNSSSTDRTWHTFGKEHARMETVGPKSEQISPEVAKRLARLEIMEEQRARTSSETADRLARRRGHEKAWRTDQSPERPQKPANDELKDSIDPKIAEKLARLRFIEEQRKGERSEAEKLARLSLLEEQRMVETSEAERLAKLSLLEEQFSKSKLVSEAENSLSRLRLSEMEVAEQQRKSTTLQEAAPPVSTLPNAPSEAKWVLRTKKATNFGAQWGNPDLVPILGRRPEPADVRDTPTSPTLSNTSERKPIIPAKPANLLTKPAENSNPVAKKSSAADAPGVSGRTPRKDTELDDADKLILAFTNITADELWKRMDNDDTNEEQIRQGSPDAQVECQEL